MSGVALRDQVLPVEEQRASTECKGFVFNLGGWHREGFERLIIFKEESDGRILSTNCFHRVVEQRVFCLGYHRRASCC